MIVRQLTGRGPDVWAIFAAGALAVVAAGMVTLSAAEAALATSAPVVLFLFALFVFATGLRSAGALDHLARWLIGRAPTARDLPAVLFLGFALGSAFLVNDALVLIGVPVLLALAVRLRAEARPLLLVLAFAVTVGSALTPFGNPQNLLVSVQSHMQAPVLTFVRYLAIPTALNLLFGAWYLRRVYGPAMPKNAAEFELLRREAPPLLPRGGWRTRLLRAPVLFVFPATMIGLVALEVFASVVGGPMIPVWETAGAGAVVLLLLSPDRSDLLRGVDWEILVLFLGLFVVVAGAEATGVIAGLERLLPIPGPGHPIPDLVTLAATSAAGPQLVSNVPWVALQIGVLQHLGYGPAPVAPWLTLSAVSTLAGNVTLLGAASNLIVVQQAESAHVPIRLGTFARHGLPIAAVTIAVVLGCLAVGL